MTTSVPPSIEQIPVDLITVANPRVRNKRVFREIVTSISQLGLKKPVTVIRRDGGARYELVCGQGRLEAFQTLGQAMIPAIVVEADPEKSMIMSLVENLARRQHRAIDLLHDIEGLKRRGYSESEIAAKTGLTMEYTRGVIRLLEKGETRLLRSVEAGQIPVSVAVDIAEADDTDVQRVLQQAYEKNQLRGRRLMLAKRLVERRRKQGKRLKVNPPRRGQSLSSEALLRAYKDDASKKRLLVRKAEVTHDRLVFITEAIRKLFADADFISLLRAEKLDTLPQTVADRLSHRQEA